jgi:hypothetical protein
MTCKFPTNHVVICGPDCSGKSTLYKNIHKISNFRWNIHDRSFLSMICYAEQYGRDSKEHRLGLLREVCDQNNRIIVLLPPLGTVLQRYRQRGDEFQNEESLMKLYDIFKKESTFLRLFPNVKFVESESYSKDIAYDCVAWIESLERSSPRNIGYSIARSTKSCGNDSLVFNTRILFDLFEEKNFEDSMSYEKESKYYKQIIKQTFTTIDNEISGKNEYSLPQSLNSRRFYYSSDTCISSIHFLIKDDKLEVHSVLRSTDVDRNASFDLKFLCHLSLQTIKRYKWPVNSVELFTKFNCAHIRYDLNKKDSK